MSNSGDKFLPPNSINGLQIVWWIPWCIQKNYMICSMKVNAQRSSTSWYQRAFYSCIFRVVKHLHKILSIRRRSAPIKPVQHDMDIWYLQNQTVITTLVKTNAKNKKSLQKYVSTMIVSKPFVMPIIALKDYTVMMLELLNIPKRWQFALGKRNMTMSGII